MNNRLIMKPLLLIAVFYAVLGQAQTQKLFNGKDLTGWMEVPFKNAGKTFMITNGIVECETGTPLSGIVYTNTPPRMNYELSLEARRVEGSDFFIGLTIPVEDRCCTVIIGGWGGSTCGVSSIDKQDAGVNQWSENVKFRNGVWYRLRVRVTPGVLQVFLNDTLYKARIEYKDADRISMRVGEILLTEPLGLATYYTRAHWRNFTLTRIEELTSDDKPREK